MDLFLVVLGFAFGFAFFHYAFNPRRIYTVHISEHQSIKTHNVYVTTSLEDVRNWMRQNSFLIETQYQYFTVDDYKIGGEPTREYYNELGFKQNSKPNPMMEEAISWLGKELEKIGERYSHAFRFGIKMYENYTFVIEVPEKVNKGDDWAMEEMSLERKFECNFKEYELLFSHPKGLINLDENFKIYQTND